MYVLQNSEDVLKATDEVVLYRLFQQSGCSGENVMGGTGMEVAAKGKSAGQRRLTHNRRVSAVAFLSTTEKMMETPEFE